MAGSAADERPPLWVGHVSLRVRDVSKSTAFWEGLGMRRIFESGEVRVLERRGGTHPILLPSVRSPALGGADQRGTSRMATEPFRPTRNEM